MINRFGLPIKNYYSPAPPVSRESAMRLWLISVSEGFRVLERVLVEMASVPRRISALNR
jgi:hypothetical protein